MADCEARAAAMAAAIERHFGREVSGFRTYRYYKGCEVLRSWIGIPLCMGIYDRAEGTTAALFSPALWTGGGMLSAEGDKKGVTWDRSLLYAFRGVFAAGLGDCVTDKLREYKDLSPEEKKAKQEEWNEKVTKAAEKASDFKLQPLQLRQSFQERPGAFFLFCLFVLSAGIFADDHIRIDQIIKAL